MKLLTRKWRQSGLFLIVLLVFSATPLWAQAVHEATLTGTVSLQAGERLPGVTVRVTSPGLVSGERQVITDSEGKFVFLGLPPAKYAVTATLQGFRTYNTRGIVLNAGSRVDLNVVLAPGAYEESITVTGAAPIIETKSATVSTTFNTEQLEKLPTARNPFYDLAMTAPGMASVGSEESWLSSPSAYGSAANENIFLVNGVNATNPRGAPWGSMINVNYNTVEEVKLLSLGSKAEYGAFSGVAIDVLTKSGGNDLKGDLAYFSKVGTAADNSTLNFGGSTKFASKKLYADPEDVLTTKSKKNWEGSFTLGGAVLKDRLWFYGGYAKYGSDTDTPLWEPLATYDASLYDIKFTGDITPSQRGWAAYHYEDSANGNVTWGQTWDPNMGYEQTSKTHTGQAQYQWVFNDRNLISAKYLSFRRKQGPSPESNIGHPGYINWWKWIGTQSIGVNGDFPYIELEKSNRDTIQIDHTHYAADFLGSHEVKYGIQYTKSEGNWVGGYFQGYANFAYPYPWDYGPAKDWWWNGPESWQWGTDDNPVFPMYNMKYTRDPWLTVRQSNSNGAFIDDTWTITPRLTLNLGLRYDNMTAKYGQGAMYEPFTSIADVKNPKVSRTRAGTGNVFDFDTWSPRLGFALILTDDNKTVLSGHVGRYFAPLSLESLRRFGPDMDTYTVDTYRFDLPMSLVDLNHNGVIDAPTEVRFATRQLYGRTPTALMSHAVNHAPSALQVVAGTESPYTDQYEMSLQRQIGNDFAIEGTYVYKHTDNLIAYRPYNNVTNDYWEWEAVPFKAWTGYETQVWQIKLKDYDGNGKVDFQDALWVKNHNNYRATNAQNVSPNGKADRTFQGLQLVVTKRQANRWSGQASLNYAISDGIAGRTVSQDWYIDGPMIMDTPFGYSLNQFQNNTDGPLPMTPKWMMKASGTYTIPRIETDFGLRWRYDSGRPFWPVQDIPQVATWMSDFQAGTFLGTANDTIVASDPNHPDYLPSSSIFDLNLAKQFTFGNYGARVSFDVLNAFNANSPNRVGWRQADYGRVYSILSPRVFRAGVKFMF